jgi:hypothetical protein
MRDNFAMKYDGPFATTADPTGLGVQPAKAWCQRTYRRAILPLDRFPPSRPFAR